LRQSVDSSPEGGSESTSSTKVSSEVSENIELDFITYDPTNDEFVLYLVEDGPWPDDEAGERKYLEDLQDRLLCAADAAIDGGVAKKFPDSRGKRVRIQVDSPHGAPPSVDELVEAVERYVHEDAEYTDALEALQHISGLRIVTGKQMGRFTRTAGGGDADE